MSERNQLHIFECVLRVSKVELSVFQNALCVHVCECVGGGDGANIMSQFGAVSTRKGAARNYPILRIANTLISNVLVPLHVTVHAN